MQHTKAHTTGVILLMTIPLSPASPPNKLLYFKTPPQNGGGCTEQRIFLPNQKGKLVEALRSCTSVQEIACKYPVPSPLQEETLLLSRQAETCKLITPNPRPPLPVATTAEPSTGISHCLLLQLQCFTIRVIKISILLRYFWIALCSSLVLQTLRSCGCWWFLITETQNPPGQVQY